MTGTPSSFGRPSTPWHTPQTTSLPPRGVWASAAFPGVAGKVSAARTPSTPKILETQLFVMIPRPTRVPEARGAHRAGLPHSGARRNTASISLTSPHRLSRFENRADDPVMGPAAAEIAAQSESDLGLARVRVTVKNRFGHRDHAGNAVAALRRLLLDESGLQRVGLLKRPKTFERDDLGLRKRTDRHGAGARRSAVDEHRAGAALTEPAAEFGSVELKIVAQHVEQRRVQVGCHAVHCAVHLETDNHE